MKNKILAILLSFTLIFTTTALSFAEDEVSSSPEPEKHSEQVVADTTKKAPVEVNVEKEAVVKEETPKVEAALGEESVKQEESEETILKSARNNNGHYTIHISVSGNGQININDAEGIYATYDTDIKNPDIKYDKLEAFVISKYSEKNIESVEFSNLRVTGNGNNTSIHLDAKIKEKPATKYTVTYEYIGTVPEGAPSSPTAFEKEAGEIITIAQKPEFEGYTFEGWNTNDVIISDGKFEMPEKNVKLTGEWKKIKENVIIHYVDEDGNTVASDYSTTINYGEGFSQNSPILEKYDLVKEEDKTVSRENVKENIEYTVVYKLKEFTITIHYIDEDGNIIVKDYTDTVEYGDNISQDSPLPEGYELVNEEDRTVIKENIMEDFEYTVVYKKIPVPVPTPDPDNPVVGPTNGNAVKTGDADACWALLNLILALATCVIAFMLIISMLMRKDDEQIEDTKALFESSWFERILSGVVGVFALLVFLITENMNLPMVWTDRWTFMMIVIFALQILVVAFAKNKDKAVEEE